MISLQIQHALRQRHGLADLEPHWKAQPSINCQGFSLQQYSLHAIASMDMFLAVPND